MSLKKDLRTLAKFADNPYDADYQPKKEMIKLFIGLLVTLPLFLGFSCQFYILISGPLFIYWIVIYVRSAEYWKALKWKLRWYILPLIPLTLLGLYLALSQSLINWIGWFFTNVVFFR